MNKKSFSLFTSKRSTTHNAGVPFPLNGILCSPIVQNKGNNFPISKHRQNMHMSLVESDVLSPNILGRKGIKIQTTGICCIKKCYYAAQQASN